MKKTQFSLLFEFTFAYCKLCLLSIGLNLFESSHLESTLGCFATSYFRFAYPKTFLAGDDYWIQSPFRKFRELFYFDQHVLSLSIFAPQLAQEDL